MDTDKLIDALRPFAQQADSMWSLNDFTKICGIEVRHYRTAALLVRQHDEAVMQKKSA